MLIGKIAIQILHKPLILGLFIYSSCQKDKEVKYESLKKSTTPLYAATDTIPDHVMQVIKLVKNATLKLSNLESSTTICYAKSQ